MRMWQIAQKNLWRRPVRSVLTAAALAIAVAAVVALVGVSESLESSFLDLYLPRGADLVVQRRGGAVELSKGIKLSVGDQLRKIPGVHEVIGSLMDLISFEDRDLFMVIVNGWEPNSPVWDRVDTLSGRRPRPDERHAVMLGRILAANLGKKTGDHLQIYGQDFTVVGIFESFSVFENGGVWMPLAELQRQMDRPGEVTGYVVKSRDKSPAGIQNLRQHIEALDPEIAATPCGEFVGNITQIKITRTMSWFTSIFAIVIGAVSVMNTMAMTVFERRAEIATLRAMGWRRMRIGRMIVGEAMFLAIFGAALGVAAGIAATFALSHWHRTSGLIQGNISLSAILEGTTVAIVIALLGAVIPAYRCTQLPIAETLHSG